MGIKWTPEEIDRLTVLTKMNVPDRQIAKVLKRCLAGVRNKRSKLGQLKEIRHRPETYRPRVAISHFGRQLNRALREAGETKKRLASRTGFAHGLIYGACNKNNRVTVSKFTVNCIATALELDEDAKASLLAAAERDKQLKGMTWTK